MKILGAAIILLGCGFAGFYMAALWKREEHAIRELSGALDYMSCELQYRMSPLADLFRQGANKTSGYLKKTMKDVSEELDRQIFPDVSMCMGAALSYNEKLPNKCRNILNELGKSLGKFDMEGQIKAIDIARQECNRAGEEMGQNRAERLRSFQTLGLCTGAALAILFL